MELKLGFLAQENSLQVLTLNTESHEVTNERADLTQMAKFNLNMLVYSDELEQVSEKITSQNKFFPVTTFNQIGNTQAPESLDFGRLVEMYHSIADRWVIKNNLNSITNMVQLSKYLTGLWSKDRHGFFEELWYLIKTNTKCSELTIVFHDVQGEEDKESLCYSQVKGAKVPNIQPGTQIEETLMKEYTNDFTGAFNVTEFNAQKGQLVACAKIDISPILIMARMEEFTPLQDALISGIFNGLQKS
ncbi:MAG: hypothetical protein CME65_03520 [Halobacteriovoraceae bacterium]|nr:hypothetical protein [Halobacteriovoraceae bacterium]|tara:strand:+ start:4206 stop:4943 length:738 start_codon:yes stop_codon:yes gene_type:complete